MNPAGLVVALRTGPAALAALGLLLPHAAGARADLRGPTRWASSAATPVQTARRVPDIHFAPTRHAVADAMLQLAGVGPDDVVYDLGSGDGRIVILAAQKYGARGVGIEIDPALVERARAVATDGEVDNRVTFVEGDLFEADLSGATVVTLFLSTSVNRRLEPKLRAELRSGARIVSHQFPIGRWTPDRTVTLDDGTTLHVWTVR